MGNAEMGTNGTYSTSDLYAAAWLLWKGLKLRDIDRRKAKMAKRLENMRQKRILTAKTLAPARKSDTKNQNKGKTVSQARLI